MLRWNKKPMTMEMPLYGYMYDTRDALVRIAHRYGLDAWRTGHGSDEVLHMEGGAGKFKDVLDHLQKINHSSGGVWTDEIFDRESA